ncbi:hypothetical protein AURDEDRAFT_116741 [Auricularia subglabra TFB-10046 SS5]|uniref:F-box domain-containing protein n=1 Tax=Auricularia subglabra (strain TFB-10046 / SS5) TaxID=717982 RepID=J0DAY7_AURST|nr:hypothetical protein AURDEDRAFT_116741 [Auricularia subglabra TFB-10046 SS5]
MAASAAATAASAIPGTNHPDFIPSTQQRSQLLDAVQVDSLAVQHIQSQIDAAHAELADIQRKTNEKVTALEAERDALRQGMHSAECIAAGVRRVPVELLATIFALVGEPWTVSSICVRWRREALALKSLWNQIKLRTVGGQASMDTIRLWLERSGSSGPLDIDIELIQRDDASKDQKNVTLPGLAYVQTKCYADQSPLHPHWTHINLYYLAQHMHRWRRFAFRFDLPLQSVPALTDLSGATPLLEEFEITRVPPPLEHVHEYHRHTDRWTWLPSSGIADAPLLRKLSLNLVPFSWSAPFLTSSMVSEITLCKMRDNEQHQSDPLYKLLGHHAPMLRTLHLEIPSMQTPFLPVSDITFPVLENLTLSGGSTLFNILSNMVVPKLRELRIDIDNNGMHSLAASLNEFLIRSSLPSVRSVHLGTVRKKLVMEEGYGIGGIELGDGELLAKFVDVRELGIGLHLEGARALMNALARDASTLPHLARLVVHGVRARHARLSVASGAADEQMLALVVAVVKGRTLNALELYASQPLSTEREEWLRKRVDDVRVVLPTGASANFLSNVIKKAAYYGGPSAYIHSHPHLPSLPPPMPPPIVMGYDDDEDGTEDDFMDDYGF